MTRTFLFFTICYLAGSIAYAQYPFESKKAEKLYQKLETYYEDYDYESILKNEEGIREYYLGKKDTLAALMYSFLGEAYLYQLNDLTTSLGFYEEEYRLRKELNTADEALKDVIYNIGYIQDQLGYYSKTEELYLEALALEEKATGTSSDGYYQVAYALIDHYIYIEDPIKGLKLAEILKKNVKDGSFEEAMVLKALGDLHEISGAYKKSEKAFTESLEILNENGLYASVEYAAVLNSLGGLYLQIGKIPLAEEIYYEALSIIERMQGDFGDMELTLKGNLARIYTALGNYTVAEEIYRENLETGKEYYGEMSFNYAIDAYNLALTYLYAGKYQESEKYHFVAADIFKQMVGENSVDYARILNNLTLLYTQTRQLEKARQYGELAVKAFTEAVGEDHQQTSFADYNLANAYLTDGETEKAEKLHQKSLEIRRKMLGKNHPVYAKSTNKMAILNWKKQRMDDALSYYRETFDNYFNQINLFFPILSEEEKSKFYYNNLKPTFEQYNAFIVETSLEQKELIGEMYNYQLATKGLLLYATNKVRESILNSGDSSLIAGYETWIAQKEQLAKLFSATDIPLDVRNAKIDSLNRISNELEKELSKASSTFAETFATRDLTWKDVQAKLKPGEGAVEVIRFRDFTPDSAGVFTDEVYYAALIVTPQTKDYPDLVLMRNGKLMETRYLSNYRNAIKYQVNEDYSYRLFWQPIANKLEGINKVYFSPDGVFNQISIYTLRNPETGNFTLDEIEIQLVTNTKDLVAFNKPSSSSGPSYLFGYPNYNMGVLEEQNKDVPQPGSEDNEEHRGLRGVRGARSTGGDSDISSLSRGGSIPRGLRGNLLRYMSSNQLLALLPGTQREVNLIESLYEEKKDTAIVYLSNEALEDNIKSVKSPRTLHIATHGFFLESDDADAQAVTDEYVENPLLRSGLILAGANSFIASGKVSDIRQLSEDGILTAYEAMNLDLDDTELVILSACETGLGEVKNGEGVYGLQRAFQVAGADAIIMSMWTVDDDATQELMTNFYEEWLSGKDKHASFIAAQKRLKAKWGAPYYWGAFVMVGQ